MCVAPQSSDVCTKCQKPLNCINEDDVTLHLRIKHVFHRGCIEPSIKANDTSCPICHRDVVFPGQDPEIVLRKKGYFNEPEDSPVRRIIFEELIAADGISKEHQGWALNRAAWLGSKQAIKCLLGDCSLDERGGAIISAVIKGHSEVVKILMKKGPLPQGVLERAGKIAIAHRRLDIAPLFYLTNV